MDAIKLWTENAAHKKAQEKGMKDGTPHTQHEFARLKEIIQANKETKI